MWHESSTALAVVAHCSQVVAEGMLFVNALSMWQEGSIGTAVERLLLWHIALEMWRINGQEEVGSSFCCDG